MTFPSSHVDPPVLLGELEPGRSHQAILDWLTDYFGQGPAVQGQARALNIIRDKTAPSHYDRLNLTEGAADNLCFRREQYLTLLDISGANSSSLTLAPLSVPPPRRLSMIRG